MPAHPWPPRSTVAAFVLAGALLAVPTALALAPEDAVVPGSGRGRAGTSAPLRQRITTVSVALDVRTGTWTTVVRFATPRTAKDAAVLRLDLVFPDDVPGGTTSRVTLRTDPDAPDPVFERATSGGRPAAPGAGTASATFDAARTAVTVRVTDPTLAGRPRPREVDGSLGTTVDPSAPGRTFDDFIALMGPKSPRASLRSGSRRLTVRRDGRTTVRLRALPVPATRYVQLDLGSTTLDAEQVPASAPGARTVRLRIPRDLLRSLPVGRTRRATVRIGTGLAYGRPTSSTIPVTLRRR